MDGIGREGRSQRLNCCIFFLSHVLLLPSSLLGVMVSHGLGRASHGSRFQASLFFSSFFGSRISFLVRRIYPPV